MTLFAEEYRGLMVMKHSIQAVGWTMSEQAVAHPNPCSVHACFHHFFFKGTVARDCTLRFSAGTVTLRTVARRYV